MSVIGQKMADSLREFADCPHGHWKCEGCGCRTSLSTLTMPLRQRLDAIKALIERVDNRCMAADGPVPPKRVEITDDEMRKIYALSGGEPGYD